MQNILVLGAGQSATFLIRRLLERAEGKDWFVSVGDRDLRLAEQVVDGHPRGSAIAFDINDAPLRGAEIDRTDVVVNLLPQAFQELVALTCLEHGRHMVSVSYQDKKLAVMSEDVRRQGLLFLAEVGLDPGIDLMSAMEIIHGVHERGGIVDSFESYGSGVPAPEVAETNPLRYAVTWNPRNVAMAGENGALYLEHGKIKIVPWHLTFDHSWMKEIPGVGTMEAYPNRDSLAYREKFAIPDTRTLIRGTLRYPGWCETWHQIVRLGLPNETIVIPELERRSFREILEMFLPDTISVSSVEWRLASHLGISKTGRILENFRWLGLLSDEPLGIPGRTAADALIHQLNTRLALPAGGSDMIILLHDIVARYPEEEGHRERIRSTLIELGEPGTTAMSRTVGLPAAVAVELLLGGELPLTGCHIPTHPAVYEPILRALEDEGLAFEESVEPAGTAEETAHVPAV